MCPPPLCHLSHDPSQELHVCFDGGAYTVLVRVVTAWRQTDEPTSALTSSWHGIPASQLICRGEMIPHTVKSTGDGSCLAKAADGYFISGTTDSSAPPVTMSTTAFSRPHTGHRGGVNAQQGACVSFHTLPTYTAKPSRATMSYRTVLRNYVQVPHMSSASIPHPKPFTLM